MEHVEGGPMAPANKFSVDITCTMRELPHLSAALLARLPNLKLLTTNGSRNYALSVSSRELPVLIASVLECWSHMLGHHVGTEIETAGET